MVNAHVKSVGSMISENVCQEISEVRIRRGMYAEEDRIF